MAAAQPDTKIVGGVDLELLAVPELCSQKPQRRKVGYIC
jgi:hypothetical protein